MNNVIARHPKYEEIIKVYNENKDSKTLRQIWLNNVKEIDPSFVEKIAYQNFVFWAGQYEKDKVEKTKALILRECGALDILKNTGDLTESDLAEAKHRIRKFGIAIFEKTLIQFLAHPDLLARMSFKEAMTLYKMLRGEEDSEKMIEMKEGQSKISNLFTFFRLQSMYLKQQKDEPNSTDEGTGTEIPIIDGRGEEIAS